MSNKPHFCSAFSGSPSKGDKIRSGFLASCLLGSHDRYGYGTPFCLGVPIVRTNMATSPLPLGPGMR